MKKAFVILSGFVFLLVLVNPVNANEAGSSSAPYRKGGRQEVKQALVNNEDAKERLTERRKKNITEFFNRMLRRFEAASARLAKLIERIESRIAKIEEENPTQNLTSQKTQLESAKDKLDLVNSKLDALEEDFSELLESDDPKALFESIKTSAKEVKDGLKEVHAILVKIITEIKGLRIYKPSASPVPTQTP